MGANLLQKHPTYTAREVDWKLMRDAYEGERRIKEEREKYLKPTGTMQEDGMNAPKGAGYLAYENYLQRAVYHELVRPALEAALGTMHRKPADIVVPDKMLPMLDHITFNGDDAQTLLMKINEQQLLAGRLGLMCDVATGADASALPYVVTYNTEAVGNWDTTKVGDDKGLRTLQFVVLNESDFERIDGLGWKHIVRHRVLAISDAVGDVWPGIEAPSGTYVAAEIRIREDAVATDFVIPSLAGKTLDSIPFVFVGPRDLVPEPDVPPMLALARIALAIYRTEADYRQALYQQGQDTLVLIGNPMKNPGESEDVKVGAGHVIILPLTGDAKYVGADSGGLKELAQAIQDDQSVAVQLGVSMLTEHSNAAESGDALRIRVSSRACTLTSVAKAGACALELILKQAASWIGADPDAVKVTPNLDFADDPALAADLVQLMSAKMLGAPLSKKSIHDWMVKREFTSLTFEEETEEVDNEAPTVVATRGIFNPNGNAPANAPPAKSGGKNVAPDNGATGTGNPKDPSAETAN